MSELTAVQNKHASTRRTLLATVSFLALASYTASTQGAHASGSEQPIVWIEGGWQFEGVTGKDDLFAPPFDSAVRALGLPSLTAIENTLGTSAGAEGSLSFQPHGSDWIFTASARYGRMNSGRHAHKEKELVGPAWAHYGFITLNQAPVVTQSITGYVDQSSKSTEAHTIVDFQVGKDVGLGLFGRATNSVVRFGARYAQLSTTSNLQAHALPDVEFYLIPQPLGKYGFLHNHHNSVSLAERHSDLRAIGPSISVNNTMGLLGNTNDGQLGMDWGVNAAILFGRQRAEVHHQSSVRYLDHNNKIIHVTANSFNSTRSRHVVVPDVGGFAGLSYRFTNARLSAGYRADFFFGALDRGLDTRHVVTTGFYGPFATISIGLGG